MKYCIADGKDQWVTGTDTLKKGVLRLCHDFKTAKYSGVAKSLAKLENISIG